MLTKPFMPDYFIKLLGFFTLLRLNLLLALCSSPFGLLWLHVLYFAHLCGRVLFRASHYIIAMAFKILFACLCFLINCSIKSWEILKCLLKHDTRILVKLAKIPVLTTLLYSGRYRFLHASTPYTLYLFSSFMEIPVPFTMDCDSLQTLFLFPSPSPHYGWQYLLSFFRTSKEHEF